MRLNGHHNTVTNMLPNRCDGDNRICRKSLLPKVGLEPTLTCVNRILSPARLPFRHFGLLRPRLAVVGAVAVLYWPHSKVATACTTFLAGVREQMLISL
jgi:hypothetical protein